MAFKRFPKKTQYMSQGDIITATSKYTGARQIENAVDLMDDKTLDSLFQEDVPVLKPIAKEKGILGLGVLEKANIRVLEKRMQIGEEFGSGDPKNADKEVRAAFGKDAETYAAVFNYGAACSKKGVSNFAQKIQGVFSGRYAKFTETVQNWGKEQARVNPEAAYMQALMVESASKDGRLPWTPSTAATVQMALDKKYYESLHDPNLDEDARTKAAETYKSRTETLREQFTADHGDASAFDTAYMQQIAMAAQSSTAVRDRYNGMSMGAVQITYSENGPMLANPDGTALTADQVSVRPVQRADEILAQHYANVRGTLDIAGPGDSRMTNSVLSQKGGIAGYSAEAAARLIAADQPMYNDAASSTFRKSDFQNAGGTMTPRAIVQATTNMAANDYDIDNGTGSGTRHEFGQMVVYPERAKTLAAVVSTGAQKKQSAVQPQVRNGVIPTGLAGEQQLGDPQQPTNTLPQPVDQQPTQDLNQTAPREMTPEEYAEQITKNALGDPMQQRAQIEQEGAAMQQRAAQIYAAQQTGNNGVQEPQAPIPSPAGYPQEYAQSQQRTPAEETLARLYEAHPELRDEISQSLYNEQQKTAQQPVADAEKVTLEKVEQATQDVKNLDEKPAPEVTEVAEDTTEETKTAEVIDGIDETDKPAEDEDVTEDVSKDVETDVENAYDADMAARYTQHQTIGEDLSRMEVCGPDIDVALLKRSFDKEIVPIRHNNSSKNKGTRREFYMAVGEVSESLTGILKDNPDLLPVNKDGEPFDIESIAIGKECKRRDVNTKLNAYSHVLDNMESLYNAMSVEQQAKLDRLYDAAHPYKQATSQLLQSYRGETVRNSDMQYGMFADKDYADDLTAHAIQDHADVSARYYTLRDISNTDFGASEFTVAAAQAMYAARKPMFSDLERGDAFADAVKTHDYEAMAKCMCEEYDAMTPAEKQAMEEAHCKNNGRKYEAPVYEDDKGNDVQVQADGRTPEDAERLPSAKALHEFMKQVDAGEVDGFNHAMYNTMSRNPDIGGIHAALYAYDKLHGGTGNVFATPSYKAEYMKTAFEEQSTVGITDIDYLSVGNIANSENNDLTHQLCQRGDGKPVATMLSRRADFIPVDAERREEWFAQRTEDMRKYLTSPDAQQEDIAAVLDRREDVFRAANESADWVKSAQEPTIEEKSEAEKAADVQSQVESFVTRADMGVKDFSGMRVAAASAGGVSQEQVAAVQNENELETMKKEALAKRFGKAANIYTGPDASPEAQDQLTTS